MSDPLGYILLAAVLVIASAVLLRFRDPASPSIRLFVKKALGALLLLFYIVASALGASVAAAMPSPTSPSSPATAPLELRLPAWADAPAAQHSTHDMLRAALCGWLTPNRFRLAEFEAGDQDRYVEVLRSVNALVAEARPTHGEASALAAAIGGEVEAGQVDAVAVVKALAVCEDPSQGLRMVAFQLGVLPSPVETAEELQEFTEGTQKLVEILTRSEDAEAASPKEKKRSRWRWSRLAPR